MMFRTGRKPEPQPEPEREEAPRFDESHEPECRLHLRCSQNQGYHVVIIAHCKYCIRSCDCSLARRAYQRGVIEQTGKVQGLLDALNMYADPDSYFAIGFWVDPPAGAFSEDVSEDHGGDYARPMPGKMAREALDAWVGASE